MIKNLTILEIEKGDRKYCLSCSPDSPLGELHDVISEMKAFVVEKINESQKQNMEQPKCQSSE
jgi:hypothetical protein